MQYAQFITQFPEFQNSDAALVQAQLTAAALEQDPSIWGVLFDQGQAYLAAHKLALSPYGQNAQMVARDQVTTYLTHWERLKIKACAPGFLVP
jgi:hypothetical protein